METWIRRTQWPLAACALLFLAAYAVPIIDPSIPRWAKRICFWTTWTTWTFFVVDYVVRFTLAKKKWRFVKRNVLDLAAIALPMFQPLRAVRLITLLRVLNRTAMGAMRGQVGIYLAFGSSLLSFLASLAVLQAERRAPGTHITSFGDALWWSVTTMTTVGYGDTYPVTATGRLIGVGLMIGGVGLLGAVTAGLATWLIDHVSDLGEDTEEVEDEVRALRRQVRLLTEEVRALARAQGVTPVSERQGRPAGRTRPPGPEQHREHRDQS